MYPNRATYGVVVWEETPQNLNTRSLIYARLLKSVFRSAYGLLWQTMAVSYLMF